MSNYQRYCAPRRGAGAGQEPSRGGQGSQFNFATANSPASMCTPPSMYHAHYKQHHYLGKQRSIQTLLESPIVEARATPPKEAFSSGKRQQQHNQFFQLHQKSQQFAALTKSITASADCLYCSKCRFQFPTSRHLVKCSNCIQDAVRKRGQKGSADGSQVSLGAILTLHKDEVFQVCKECVDTQNIQKAGQKDLLVCPTCCCELEESQTGSAAQGLKARIDQCQFLLSPCEKTNLMKMQQFRMVIPNLLYVIGLPRKFAQEDIVRQPRFFGQFGKIQRVLINHYTKDFYEQQGQCAVYIWYESEVNVAIALKCLNGLRIQTASQMQHNSSQSYAQTTILKCSFGTSKYCLNFLKEATCENSISMKQSRSNCFSKKHGHKYSQTSSDSLEMDCHGAQSPLIMAAPCPFLHYIERRRDKVIQDDIEFKDYLAQQEKIVEDFMNVLGVQTIAHKNEYYGHQQHHHGYHKEVVSRMGLPCPAFVLGITLKQILKQAKQLNKLEKVKEVLYLRGVCQELPKKLVARRSSTPFDEIVTLPSLAPVTILIHYYKRGSKSSTDAFTVASTGAASSLTDLVHSLDMELQQQIRQNLSQLIQHPNSPNLHVLSHPSRTTNFQGYFPPNGTVQMTEYFGGGEQVGLHHGPAYATDSLYREDADKARKRAEKQAERIKMKQMVEQSLKSKVNAEPWDPSQYQNRLKSIKNEGRLEIQAKSGEPQPGDSFKAVSASSTDKNLGIFNRQIDLHQRAVVADCINELGIFCDDAPVQDPELFTKRVHNSANSLQQESSSFYEREMKNHGKENQEASDDHVVGGSTAPKITLREGQFPPTTDSSFSNSESLKNQPKQGHFARNLRI